MPDRYSFRLLVGAKRQVTLPVRLLQLLSLEEGSQIQIEVEGDSVRLVPLISVPRHLVSEFVLREMEGRRGAKPSDLSFEEFTEALDGDSTVAATEATQEAHSAVR